jgi:hypothetical protein
MNTNNNKKVIQICKSKNTKKYKYVKERIKNTNMQSKNTQKKIQTIFRHVHKSTISVLNNILQIKLFYMKIQETYLKRETFKRLLLISKLLY